MFLKPQSNSLPQPVSRHGVFSEVFPLVAAFVAISFAFGVLAREAGLSLAMACFLSATTYAGTAQVVALGLMAAHQPIWMIVLVVAMINSRFILLSSVMAPKVRSWKPLQRWMFAFQLTDETFALMLPTRGRAFPTPSEAMALQWGAYVAWILGTALGFGFGGDSRLLHALGLDFALVAMMIAVLVLQLVDFRACVVAAFAGLFALLFHWAGLAWVATLGAALVAPFVGIYLERRCSPTKS